MGIRWTLVLAASAALMLAACQGEPGAKGDKGGAGAQGAAGAAGEQGVAGAAGTQGSAGGPGPKGDKGDKGDRGEAGGTQLRVIASDSNTASCDTGETLVSAYCSGGSGVPNISRNSLVGTLAECTAPASITIICGKI